MSEHPRSPDLSPGSQACTAALASRLRPDLFKALCDPSRIAVVCRLAAAAGPLTVTEISDCCGVHISGVSRHLATLRDAGAVQAEKQGREVRYRLDCNYLSETLRDLADAFEVCQAACCQGDEA